MRAFPIRRVAVAAPLLGGLALLVAVVAACDTSQPSPDDRRAPSPGTPVAAAAAASANPVATVQTPWIAVTDQRRDVLELTVEQVRGILTGEIADWTELGGSAAPIHAYLPDGHVEGIASGLGVAPGDLRATPRPAAELPGIVAAEPGAFALVAHADLRPGVLGLIVDGFDPYRDLSSESPLLEVTEVAAGVAPPAAAEVDPVLLLATGELIPARCTNQALEEVGDYGAMFDGTRELLSHAEVAVSSLEVPLTDVGGPTPCLETFVLQGSPLVVDAIAGAGTDVLFPIGNHMMDCWDGCDGAAALADTLDRLHAAGVLTTGAGPDLEAAVEPAVLAVQTASGPVTFAFLGFDTFTPWYHATEATPGISPYDEATFAALIEEAAQSVDHVVVAMNWGIEYTVDPTEFQIDLGRAAIDAGATLVIGNHPHSVQALDVLDGGIAAYALGNFVFDQDWSVETTQSAILEVGLLKDRVLGYRLRPVVLTGDLPDLYRALYRPELVDPAGDGRAILDRIWDAADRLPPPPEE